MLVHTLDAQRRLLLLSPHGALRAEDFQSVAAEVDPFLQESGGLNGIVIQAERFPGWSDFSSLLAHLRFVREHHKKVRRVAVVTDDNVMAALPGLASHFVDADVKHFAAPDRDAAIAWAETGSAG